MKDQPALSQPPLREANNSLTCRERRIMFSPWRLICILTFSIFLIEMLDMMILTYLTNLPKLVECLIDSTILSLVLFPILYLYLFKPLLHLVNDYRASEEDLRHARYNLEQKVTERTAKLVLAMDLLKQEIAERHQAEVALRESENRFHEIFEQSEDAIVMIARDGNTILDINSMTERLFFKPREQLLSEGVRGLCSGTAATALAKMIDELCTGNAPVELKQLEVHTENSEMHILAFRGKPITVGGEEVFYTTFRDITRRIRLEEESREIQSRLIHANRMTSLGTLVASVAHEINNPNNFILMNADLLKQTWNDIYSVLLERFEREGEFQIGRTTFSEAAQFLPEAYDGIAEGARRIREIVDNLKDHGRADRDSLASLADINDVVRLSVSLLNHLISRTTHKFILELGEQLPAVRGSSRQLEQVVINLITNALQALPDANHGIRVSTSFDENHQQVVLSVEDEGGGIPEEIASHIMEPFFTTRLDRGGTGLGLAICSTIINDHGGTICFDSLPAKGTVFTISLKPAEATA